MEIKKNKLLFNINDDEINGIITDNKEVIIDLLNQDKASIIREDFQYNFFNNTIYDYMLSEIEKKNLVLKDEDKKIKDSLRIIGLNKWDLNRHITTLSESEKKLLQISIGLLANPQVLVFEEPFRKLDLKNQKKIILFLRKIKEKYHKTIIFITNDSDMLYKYSDYLIIIKNNKKIIEGPSKKVFEQVDLFIENNITIPEIIEFTYKAKKKYNVKIDYHNDIRDIIKDIYKHV